MNSPDGLTNEERGTCKRGHPWIEENIRTRKIGGKICRVCSNSRDRIYHKIKNDLNKTAKGPKTNFNCGCPLTAENTVVYPSGRKQCKTHADIRNKARLRRSTPLEMNCLYCGTPLLNNTLKWARKYCSQKCLRRNDASGFKQRADFYGVPYEPISKAFVFERDNYKCQHCGKHCIYGSRVWKDKPTVDHILPMSKGGGHVKDNVQTLCGKCNSKKGASVAREPKLSTSCDLSRYAAATPSTPEERNCGRCGAPYTTAIPNQIYCRPVCRRRAREKRRARHGQLRALVKNKPQPQPVKIDFSWSRLRSRKLKL